MALRSSVPSFHDVVRPLPAVSQGHMKYHHSAGKTEHGLEHLQAHVNGKEYGSHSEGIQGPHETGGQKGLPNRVKVQDYFHIFRRDRRG
jgi:hypothetical protein